MQLEHNILGFNLDDSMCKKKRYRKINQLTFLIVNTFWVQSCGCAAKCTSGPVRVKVYGNPLSRAATCRKTDTVRQ